MKRNTNLIQLSRDHHYGLLCCWKIREGIKHEIEYNRIKDYINFFWKEKLSHHFDTEDTVFEPVSKDEKFITMELEHDEIQNLVLLINQVEDYQLLHQFADTLQQHIRFEERDLFPALEKTLTEEELSKIGIQLEELISEREENYPDEFWINK